MKEQASKTVFSRSSEQKLLNTAEAAQYIGITPGTLEVWRCVKRHDIAHLKIGRLIRYRKTDLDTFLASCIVGNIAG